MPKTHDDAVIRERAYLLWERDGRPDGREMEYWTLASVSFTSESPVQTLTDPAPKKAKADALKAAASKAKAVPAKSAKAEPKLKPKKK